jgi:hypothetical protein
VPLLAPGQQSSADVDNNRSDQRSCVSLHVMLPQAVGSSKALVEVASMQMAAAALGAGADCSHTFCSCELEAGECSMCSTSHSIADISRSSSSSSVTCRTANSFTAGSAGVDWGHKQLSGLQDSFKPDHYFVLCTDPASWQQQALTAAEHGNLAAVLSSRSTRSGSWLGHHCGGGKGNGCKQFALWRYIGCKS